MGGIEFSTDADGKGQYRVSGASEWIPFLSDVLGSMIQPGYKLRIGWAVAASIDAFDNSFSDQSYRYMNIANIEGKGFTTLTTSIITYIGVITKDGTMTNYDSVTSVSLPSDALYVICCGGYSNSTSVTYTFS